MGDPRTSYIRQVGRKLELPRRKKRALLAGLRLELEERFSGQAGPEEILSQVGPPAATARSLLGGVSPQERERYRTRKRRRLGCIIAALAVLLVVSVVTVIYLDATQIARVKTIITEDFVPNEAFNYSVPIDNFGK